MAAKKTAKKTAETAPAAKKTAKAPAAKKVAASKTGKSPAVTTAKAPAAKTSKPAAPKAAVQPSADAIARAAYLNYRRRIENGLPGDSHTDWVEAERQLREGK